MNTQPIILMKSIERKEISEKIETAAQLIERVETIEIITTIQEKIERTEKSEKITQRQPGAS